MGRGNQRLVVGLVPFFLASCIEYESQRDGSVWDCPDGQEFEVLFSFQADGEIASTPAIGGDGTIYFGTKNATMYAVDCHGNEKWKWRCEEVEGDSCPQAFEGSPAVGTDGTIYIGDDIMVPNFFFALTPDGKIKWEYVTGLVYGQMDSSPAIADDGTVFIGSHGSSGYVGPVGQLVALNDKGEPLAGFPLQTRAIWGSPAFDNGVLFVGDNDRAQQRVFAVDKQANILWEAVLTASDGQGAERLAQSSVAVDGEGKILVVEVSRLPAQPVPEDFASLYRIDPVDGEILWKAELDPDLVRDVTGVPLVRRTDTGEEIVLALGSSHLLLADARTREIRELPAFNAAQGSPVLGDDGAIYLVGRPAGSQSDAVFCKLGKDGNIEGSSQVLGDTEMVTSSLQMGRGGVVYFGTSAGKLYAVQTTAGGLDKRAPWPTFRHDERNTGNAGKE